MLNSLADRPNITVEHAQKLFPQFQDITFVGKGPDKVVFRGILGNEEYALKVLNKPKSLDLDKHNTETLSLREACEKVAFRECRSRHMVMPGPVGLSLAQIDDHDVMYFSEAFVEGLGLECILAEQGPLSTLEVLKLGTQLAGAIRSLWNIGKVHRDIKPGNVIVDRQRDHFVLLDSGLVFDVAGDLLHDAVPRGTTRYHSPEQFGRGRRLQVVDFRSDIYALGSSMYEAATGRHPFSTEAQTPWRLFYSISTVAPVRPTEYAPHLPDALEAIILRMLAKSPHDRYLTCDLLLDALQEIGDDDV